MWDLLKHKHTHKLFNSGSPLLNHSIQGWYTKWGTQKYIPTFLPFLFRSKQKSTLSYTQSLFFPNFCPFLNASFWVLKNWETCSYHNTYLPRTNESSMDKNSNSPFFNKIKASSLRWKMKLAYACFWGYGIYS